MTVKERLIKYLEYKKISKSEFGRTIGVSSAYISSMRKSIQPDKIQSIAFNYSDLNTEWLLTGKGEMLKNENSLNEDVFDKIKNMDITDIALMDLEIAEKKIDWLEKVEEKHKKEIENLKKHIIQLENKIDHYEKELLKK